MKLKYVNTLTDTGNFPIIVKTKKKTQICEMIPALRLHKIVGFFLQLIIFVLRILANKKKKRQYLLG